MLNRIALSAIGIVSLAYLVGCEGGAWSTPAAPFGLLATVGDRKVTINWESMSGATF